jgi:hypothetical protein
MRVEPIRVCKEIIEYLASGRLAILMNECVDPQKLREEVAEPKDLLHGRPNLLERRYQFLPDLFVVFESGALKI